MDNRRNGMFTSSNMYRLINFGKDGKSLGAPAKTYIAEKRRERRLKTSIQIEATSHELSWGRALEGYVHDNYIEPEYVLESDITLFHEKGLFCGTPDLTAPDCISDIKCPHTRNSFCDLVEIIEKASIEFFKEENPKFYWQIVSNCVLAKKAYGELIVYMPYAREIPEIIEYIEILDDWQMQLDIQWVVNNRDNISRLPHLPNDSEYKNLYRFKFKVPQEDIDLLMERTTLANTHLNL